MCPSESTPRYLGMAVQKLQPLSVPSSDQLGRQPSLCAESVLHVFGGWSPSIALSLGEQLLACLIDLLLAASAIIEQYHNRSRSSIKSSVASGVAAKTQKALVTSSNEVHVSHAVLFPRPPNDDTVSHPVKAWKAIHRAGPSQ